MNLIFGLLNTSCPLNENVETFLTGELYPSEEKPFLVNDSL